MGRGRCVLPRACRRLPATRCQRYIDDRLVTFFRVRDHPDDLVRACSLTPYSLTEFTAALARSDDPLEEARRVWVLGRQAFAGDRPNPGNWGQHPQPTPPRAGGGRRAPPRNSIRSTSTRGRCSMWRSTASTAQHSSRSGAVGRDGLRRPALSPRADGLWRWLPPRRVRRGSPSLRRRLPQGGRAWRAGASAGTPPTSTTTSTRAGVASTSTCPSRRSPHADSAAPNPWDVLPRLRRDRRGPALAHRRNLAMQHLLDLARPYWPLIPSPSSSGPSSALRSPTPCGGTPPARWDAFVAARPRAAFAVRILRAMSPHLRKLVIAWRDLAASRSALSRCPRSPRRPARSSSARRAASPAPSAPTVDHPQPPPHPTPRDGVAFDVATCAAAPSGR